MCTVLVQLHKRCEDMAAWAARLLEVDQCQAVHQCGLRLQQRRGATTTTTAWYTGLGLRLQQRRGAQVWGYDYYFRPVSFAWLMGNSRHKHSWGFSVASATPLQQRRGSQVRGYDYRKNKIKKWCGTLVWGYDYNNGSLQGGRRATPVSCLTLMGLNAFNSCSYRVVILGGCCGRSDPVHLWLVCTLLLMDGSRWADTCQNLIL